MQGGRALSRVSVPCVLKCPSPVIKRHRVNLRAEGREASLTPAPERTRRLPAEQGPELGVLWGTSFTRAYNYSNQAGMLEVMIKT